RRRDRLLALGDPGAPEGALRAELRFACQSAQDRSPDPVARECLERGAPPAIITVHRLHEPEPRIMEVFLERRRIVRPCSIKARGDRSRKSRITQDELLAGLFVP